MCFIAFNRLNTLRSSIQLTMEIESESMIPLLDVLVVRKGHARATHTGSYLNFEFNHVKRGIIRSLHDRASTIRQERQALFIEIDNPRRDLQLNDYPQ
jgi:hypothetical protein